MGQLPLETMYRANVITMPINAKKRRNFFLEVPLSAMAPNTGAQRATAIPAMEFASPSRAVLIVVSAPTLQNCLKKIGKNPAITVVAKAELAQSYMAQPKIAFLLLVCMGCRLF